MPGTEVVLITCGAPDDRGYVCPLDVFILRFVVELVERGELQCNPGVGARTPGDASDLSRQNYVAPSE